ncbi:MAG: hypothetical protein DRP79_00065 [Planctomycetota bacterium]|nr:MAG: hypothetical protein DRP79_00065 [Planctomycetota bacterium]
MKRMQYIVVVPMLVTLLCPLHDGVAQEATLHRDERENTAVLRILNSEDIAATHSAEANFQQRDWRVGMEKLVRIFRGKPDMLIPSGDGRTFVSVWEYFHNRVVTLPPSATEAYRAEDGGLVRRFERAKTNLDIAAVRELARDHLFTEVGRAALRFLMEHYYEGRQFTEALSCAARFEKYLAFERDDSVQVAAMKLLCLARTGRVGEFDSAAARMVREMANEKVKWRGVTMTFPEFAGRLSAVAGAVERRDNTGPLLPACGGPPLLPRRASARVAGAYPPEESPSADTLAAWQAETPFTDVYPVLSNGTIYLRLRSSLFAFDLDDTAGPRWKRHFPASPSNAAVAPGDGKSRMAAVCAAAVNDGRVFTTFRDKDGVARLICLNAKSGRDLWKTGKEGGKRVIDSARAISPPACIGGSVYVTAILPSGAGDDDYYLVRLDAADGGVIYSTFLCTRIAPREGGAALYPPAPAIIADGTIYVATNAGAVCAVDAMSGRLRWVSQYDQFNSVTASPGANRFERAIRRDVSFAYGVPVVHGGVIAVAPPEADGLIAMDAENGRALWRLDNAARQYAHLVGARNGAFFLSGRKIGAFDATTGRALWPSEPDLGARVGGKGFLAGDLLVLPGNGILAFVDTRDGRVVARNDVKGLLQGPSSVKIAGLTGNLLRARESIISASRSGLVIYPAGKMEHASSRP